MPITGARAYGHAHVNDDMKEQNAGDPIGIAAAEHASLSFGDRDDPHEQEEIDPPGNRVLPRKAEKPSPDGAEK